MYESFWGLTEAPFNLTPDPRFLYLSRKHENALMLLHVAITRNKGAALLLGDIGFGKTTVSRKLLELLDPVQYKVVLIVNPIMSPVQTLQEILAQIGVETTTRNRQALVNILHQQLLCFYERGQKVVVIVDEAHLLRGAASFEELRLLLNCQMNDQFLLSLLLVGQIELRKKLEKVPALKQRLWARYELKSLDQQETADMIEFRLRKAGFAQEQSPFTPDAVFEIHKFSNGCPRVVCQVADTALLVAMGQKQNRIDGFMMHSVIQEFDGREW